jgi:hypothetical protein
MSDSFYVQNPWTGLVIDIGENSHAPSPGTLLRANPKETSAPGNAYQLWTFAPSNEEPVKTLLNYFFLRNANPASPFVIDIQEQGNVITRSPGGQTIKAGSRLDAWTVKSGQAGDLDDNHPASSNQIWGFTQDPESGFYFIENWLTGFVIDIEEKGLPPGQQPGAGTHLDAWPKKTGSQTIRNQLWQFVDPNGTPVKVPGPPSVVVKPPPGQVSVAR